MKEKIYNFTFILFCFFSLIFIFYNNQEVAQVLIDAVNLFFKKVFVSLFPMFILQDLFINLNLPYYFYKLLSKPFNILFATSGVASYVFIMSLISGTPSNAYILKELLNTNIISVKEANHYLTFTYFSNPLFLITMLSLIFPLNIVLKIIIIHYFANIIIAFLLKKKAPSISINSLNLKQTNISKTLILSIKKSMNTLIMILGTIVFYMLLSYIITNIISMNDFFASLISGILELTNGLNHLSKLQTFTKIKEIMAISFISFGGLSIHTQIKAILEESPLNYSYFFKGRIYQTIISIILVILI